VKAGRILMKDHDLSEALDFARDARREHRASKVSLELDQRREQVA
jgi:hypothetical protein